MNSSRKNGMIKTGIGTILIVIGIVLTYLNYMAAKAGIKSFYYIYSGLIVCGIYMMFDGIVGALFGDNKKEILRKGDKFATVLFYVMATIIVLCIGVIYLMSKIRTG